MHHLGELRRPQRPTLTKQQVVNVLHRQSSDFAEDVERPEHFLEIDQADVPGALLPFDDRFQGVRGGAVSTTGVEEDEVEFLAKFRHREQAWYRESKC